jgi:polyhydroxyalkanoate synthesis regulator phasin
MMVSRDRIQEVLDDAVRRGRVTRDDANEMVSDLVRRGRRQTDDLMKDLEQLLGRSRDQFEDATGDARKQARKGATRARRQPSVDRVLREVDRGRRAAGLPPSFPIIGYDDLSAAQVVDRLADLSPAELRKVRDYERRNANRKSVLTAIEKALA